MSGVEVDAKIYPCDYLDEFELGCHAEDIVHADRQIEVALTVEVGTILVPCPLAATCTFRSGYSLQHLCTGGCSTLRAYQQYSIEILIC